MLILFQIYLFFYFVNICLVAIEFLGSQGTLQEDIDVWLIVGVLGVVFASALLTIPYVVDAITGNNCTTLREVVLANTCKLSPEGNTVQVSQDTVLTWGLGSRVLKVFSYVLNYNRTNCYPDSINYDIKYYVRCVKLNPFISKKLKNKIEMLAEII